MFQNFFKGIKGLNTEKYATVISAFEAIKFTTDREIWKRKYSK